MTTSDLAALIFDVDGTLANTEEGHRIAFNQAFRDAGLGWHWDRGLYRDLLAVTGGRERIRHYIEHYGTELSPRDRPPRTDLDRFVARLHVTKTRHYTALLAHGDMALRPGVKRLLHEARRAGLRLAIATTTSAINVSELLVNTLGSDAQSWFEVIAAGDIVTRKKPAPEIYHYALAALDLPVERCLALEDSANGLQAALAAGLQTIVTVNDYTRDHDFGGARLVLNHLGEPDEPFEVLGGDPLRFEFVCVDLLRQMTEE